MRGQEPARILDVGCGDGSLTLGFLSERSQITFLDVSQGMLDTVASRIPIRLKNNVEYVNSDINQAQLAGSYDLITFVGVLAYVEDVSDIVSRIVNLLADNGHVIFEYTNAGHALGRWGFIYRFLAGLVKPPKGKTFRHCKREVESALAAEGLEIVKQYRYSYSVPILSRFLPKGRTFERVRRIFGSADKPRRQVFGSERVALLRRSQGALGTEK